MPDRLSLHGHVPVNTIGHCAGTLAFGILLYLLLLDWRRATFERSLLPSIAAGLTFLWNAGSLIGMATASAGDPVADAIVAAGLWRWKGLGSRLWIRFQSGSSQRTPLHHRFAPINAGFE